MDAERTRRQEIEALLRTGPWSLRELAAELGIRVRDAEDELRHVVRSIGRKAVRVEPAVCLDCGFRFGKRERLSSPSRCPRCRSEQVAPPRVSIGGS